MPFMAVLDKTTKHHKFCPQANDEKIKKFQMV
jgi:hypothetical protein